MGVLLRPLLFGSLTIMTMLVCVSVWAGVFRQQMLEAMGVYVGPGGSDAAAAAGITNGGGGGNSSLGAILLGTGGDTITGNNPAGMNHDRDKLSQEEVDAMFLAFKFTKGVTEALCAVRDASCSICLCAFEEGEPLRRLACGQSYHAHCLDRWLLTNASCPRWRMKARISGDHLLGGRSSLLRAVRHRIAYARAAVVDAATSIADFVRPALSLSAIAASFAYTQRVRNEDEVADVEEERGWQRERLILHETANGDNGERLEEEIGTKLV